MKAAGSDVQSCGGSGAVEKKSDFEINQIG
jgi:hypothetical protein